MRSLLIFVESRFPVNRQRIKKTINTFLDSERIKGDVEISVAIVGDRKMRYYNEEYHKEQGSTTVLSFTLEDPSVSNVGGFINSPDGVLRLGDVIVSYPQAVKRAGEDDMLVDDKIDELLIHGLNNLIGKGE